VRSVDVVSHGLGQKEHPHRRLRCRCSARSGPVRSAPEATAGTPASALLTHSRRWSRSAPPGSVGQASDSRGSSIGVCRAGSGRDDQSQPWPCRRLGRRALFLAGWTRVGESGAVGKKRLEMVGMTKPSSAEPHRHHPRGSRPAGSPGRVAGRCGVQPRLKGWRKPLLRLQPGESVPRNATLRTWRPNAHRQL
jgi:hypothetical protein